MLLLLGLIGTLFAPHAGAEDGPLDGTFDIDAAYVVLDHDVLELNARVGYPNNTRIRRALEDGVTLAFDLEVSIIRPRHFWFNATLLDTTLRRDLTYHAVSGRYVVRNEATSQQQSFANLEEALADLRRIQDMPILVQSQLGSGPWQVAVRAGVSRGRMPAPMRALMFWGDEWHRTSDWYTWMLTL